MAVGSDYHVYVGCETGILKGIDIGRKVSVNLNNVQNLQKKHEITCLCWGNAEQTELYLGLNNQTVKIFDITDQKVTDEINVKCGTGKIVGLAKYNGLLTCVESGIIKLWNSNNENQIEINAGPDLCKMTANPVKLGIISTGGKENDLKIWDLNKPKQPVFRAKNVRCDFLDLRVPICVLNMKFFPNSDKIVVTTGHHQVRVYDPSGMQRRPVIDMEFDSYPIQALSITNEEHQVLVGNTQGRMALIDLRKKAMVHVYKGFAGSIRDIQFDPVNSHVYSCGIDRFLRVHDFVTHKLLLKMYLKSSLNNLLLYTKTNDLFTNQEDSLVDNTGSIENVEDPDNEIWDNMEIVSNKKQKTTTSLNKNTKHKRKSKSILEEFHSVIKKKKKKTKISL